MINIYEYILGKTNPNIKKENELYQYFFDTIENSDYCIDEDISTGIKNLHAILEKSGECEIFNIITDGIVSLLNSGEYRITLINNPSKDYLEKYDKFIEIHTIPKLDDIFIQIWDFTNKKWYFSEIESSQQELENFDVLLVPYYSNYKKQQFIEDYWKAGALIEAGFYYENVPKNKECEAVNKLEDFFNELSK